MNNCLELRISQEDTSFHAGSTQKQHKHGFIHKHHHKTYPSKYDSSTWSADEEEYPGLVGNVEKQNDLSLPCTRSVDSVEGDDIPEVQPNNNHSNRRASTTEERRNPFACREGNTFIWQNVNMTLVSTMLRLIILLA